MGGKGARNVLTMWPRLDAQAARATHKHNSWTPASEPRVSFGFPFPLQCVAAIMQMLLTKREGREGREAGGHHPLSAHSTAHCNLHLNDPSKLRARTEILPYSIIIEHQRLVASFAKILRSAKKEKINFLY